MAINASRILVSNDDTPEKETEIVAEQDYVCRNPKCDNYQKVVETTSNKVPYTKA